MRNNVLNLLLFVGLAAGFYFLWEYAEKNWIPKPKDQAAEAKKQADDDAKLQAEQDAKRKAAERAAEEKGLAGMAVGGGFLPASTEATRQTAETARRRDEEQVREHRKNVAAAASSYPATVVPPVKPPPPQPTLVPLGDPEYYTPVLLTTRGGAVQQVMLTRFAEADRLGREVKGVPLYLVPGVPRVRERYLADGFPTPDLKAGKVPAGTELAEPSYTLFHYPTPDEKTPDSRLGDIDWTVVAEERPAGGEHKVVFEAELGDPYFVKFRKTYTLGPKDYHVGLKLEIERLPGGQKGKGQLRYQLSGPHGLPIEGEWYTSSYRVALVGWNDRKNVPRRQYETAADIAIKRGGEPVPKGENTFKYMAIATQYFTSAVAVDDTAEGGAKNPWAYVRATTELPFDKKADPNQPFFSDVTVRAASDTLDLAAGEKVEHKYVLYNGPAKVKLLGMMEGNREVDAALVKRYQDKLGLKTITDYQSPTWLGSFASTIYWTDLVIAFTNLMHWLLAVIHTVVPNWAMCIVVVTLIVRMMLLYPSKKQTAMNMRMMEIQKRLAPEFEKLKKQYADDFHGYNRAKMQLMMSHGVNPAAQLGGCLLLFAQMPIMMGLYFCLQESVFFRLSDFLWIDNLAAPDMTVWWGESIPYVSSPDNIGGMLYLGPYFNVLPIIAVVLMIGQQLKMLPPPTDDQSRQQRTMMKIMMFIMPLLFYKFAAGLALYFIIGTIWGFGERALIPKPDPKKFEEEARAKAAAANDPDAPRKPKGLVGRMLEKAKERMEEMKRQADEQSRRQIRNKNEPEQGGGASDPANPQQRRDDRRDKKKKRRK